MDNSSVLSVFSERLKKLREDKAFTLQMLGKELGVSGVAIGRWERGARVPTIETLVMLAKYFGVSADYLVGLDDK